MSDNPFAFTAPTFGDAAAGFVSVAKDSAHYSHDGMADSVLRRDIAGDMRTAVIARLNEIALPAPDEQVRLITMRLFNSVEFVAAIAERERISHMRSATYSINHKAASTIIGLLDADRIGSCELLISNLRNKAHREKERLMQEIFVKHPRIDLWYASSHAKIITMATEAGNHYTIEGSGNHAQNSRIEQYCLDNSKRLYDFTGEWMAELRAFLAGSARTSQA